jgi:hypothetical protein
MTTNKFGVGLLLLFSFSAWLQGRIVVASGFVRPALPHAHAIFHGGVGCKIYDAIICARHNKLPGSTFDL